MPKNGILSLENDFYYVKKTMKNCPQKFPRAQNTLNEICLYEQKFVDFGKI